MFARRTQGISILEFTLVVLVVGFLVVIAATHILRLQVAVERAAMQQVVSGMKQLMAHEFAYRMLQDERHLLGRYQGCNAFTYLAQKPANYRGELIKNVLDNVKPGSWYYDSSERTMVYLPKNKRHFTSSRLNPLGARFKVRLEYVDINRNGVYDQGDKPTGLQLKALDQYRWLIQG